MGLWGNRGMGKEEYGERGKPSGKASGGFPLSPNILTLLQFFGNAF